MSLISSNDGNDWSLALAKYEAAVDSVGKAKFTKLDAFYKEELVSRIQERREAGDPHITQEELCMVMEWKLSRGTWRPRLLAFVQGLSENQVREATSKSFSALPDLRAAVQQLTVLKGVGPATASAVLAAAAPAIAPFMSDEALDAVIGRREYTLKSYLEFAHALQEKSKVLEHLTPVDLERALWAKSKLPGNLVKVEEQRQSKERGRRRRKKTDDAKEGEPDENETSEGDEQQARAKNKRPRVEDGKKESKRVTRANGKKDGK